MMTTVQAQAASAAAVRPAVDARAEDWTNGVSKASKNVEWYQATLDQVPQTAKEIFRDYSKIPEDEVLDHIYRVRDKAWEM
jgi:ABC-type sugar transport system substrate-binding protein